MNEKLTTKQLKVIDEIVDEALLMAKGKIVEAILNPLTANTTQDECDWRDEKPKYTIRLYSNGRWQMEGK